MHRIREYPKLHVPAHDSHRVERCPPSRRRRRGPRSLEALMRRSRHRFTPSPGACGEALAVPTGTPGVGPVPLPTTVSSASPRSSSTTAAASAAGEAMVSPPANDLSSLFARCTLNSRCDCNFSQHLRIWSVNVRKLLRRRAELEARLRNAGVHILLLQETWLSDSVEEIALQGYELVGRLDRVLGPKKGYGGVAIFVRSDISNVALSPRCTPPQSS